MHATSAPGQASSCFYAEPIKLRLPYRVLSEIARCGFILRPVSMHEFYYSWLFASTCWGKEKRTLNPKP